MKMNQLRVITFILLPAFPMLRPGLVLGTSFTLSHVYDASSNVTISINSMVLQGQPSVVAPNTLVTYYSCGNKLTQSVVIESSIPLTVYFNRILTIQESVLVSSSERYSIPGSTPERFNCTSNLPVTLSHSHEFSEGFWGVFI